MEKKMSEEKPPEHSKARIALLVVNAVVLVVTVAFNMLANVAAGVIPGLFRESIGESIGDNTIEQNPINISPAPWTFALVWGSIFIMQFLFVGYSLSLICRRGPDSYLYLSPPEMVPIPTYWAYMIANVCAVTWLFLNDREYKVADGILIALFAFLLIIALAFALRGIHVTSPALRANGLDKEILLNRIFVQNALAIYTTWVIIATLVNFPSVVTKVEVLEQDIAGTISLGILSAELVIWFLLDVTILARFTNYVIMPYVVVLVALAGVLNKNFVAWETNSLFSVILIIVAGFTFIVKLITTVLRHRAYSKDMAVMTPTNEEGYKQGKQ